jgi:hypothetical protein
VVKGKSMPAESRFEVATRCGYRAVVRGSRGTEGKNMPPEFYRVPGVGPGVGAREVSEDVKLDSLAICLNAMIRLLQRV